jgi:hypothetical protein
MDMCGGVQDSHLAGYEYEKWDFMRRELLEVTPLASVPDDTFQQAEIRSTLLHPSPSPPPHSFRETVYKLDIK